MPNPRTRRNGRMVVMTLLIAGIALAIFARISRVKTIPATQPTTITVE